MLAREFISRIDSDPPPRVVLCGPGKAGFNKEPFEPLLADRAVEALLAKYVDPGLADMVYAVFYADETEPSKVSLEAQTFPFLAERRVIVVRNAQRYMGMAAGPRSPLAPLLEYVKNPSDTTLLILVSSEVDQRKALFKACKENGVLVECPQLGDREAQEWVRAEAGRLRKRIGGPAIEELLRRAGGRLGDINNAVSLAASYVGDAEDITETDVVAACSDVAEETVWALTDAIAEADPARALKILQDLSDLGKSPDEIIGIVNWLLETAYRAAPESTLEPKSRFVADKVAPLVRRFGFEKIKTACTLCTDTHFMMRCTGVDRNLALELLTLKLSYRPARRRASR